MYCSLLFPNPTSQFFSFKTPPTSQLILRNTPEQLTQTSPPNTEGADVNTAVRKDAAAIVQRHIRLLHEYNEIKDIGQGLMGLIAEARGVRHVEVQRDFGIGDGD